MNQLFLYSETTDGVTVRVNPSYLPDQSDPDQPLFVWAYHIRIENGRNDRVQLISRHWIITDGAGRRQEVTGAGVVGEQPEILPGQAYDYVSGCPLPTPAGIMAGSYAMIDGSGASFTVRIPAFSLEIPGAAGLPN